MPTLENLKTMLNGYDALGIQSKELKSALLLYMKMSPQLEKTEVVISLRDDLPAETLSHRNIVSGPASLYKILRDYLELNMFSSQIITK